MKINALIVDDNQIDRHILKRWLKKCSFETNVVEVSDGQFALDYFEENKGMQADGYPPSIIFLDINMPRVDGFGFLEAFSKIRDRDQLGSTVVVMFTSSPHQNDRENAFKWDFVTNYIVKGEFETQQIEEIVTGYSAKQSA